jgi:hypothetical protein
VSEIVKGEWLIARVITHGCVWHRREWHRGTLEPQRRKDVTTQILFVARSRRPRNDVLENPVAEIRVNVAAARRAAEKRIALDELFDWLRLTREEWPKVRGQAGRVAQHAPHGRFRRVVSGDSRVPKIVVRLAVECELPVFYERHDGGRRKWFRDRRERVRGLRCGLNQLLAIRPAESGLPQNLSNRWPRRPRPMALPPRQ